MTSQSRVLRVSLKFLMIAITFLCTLATFLSLQVTRLRSRQQVIDEIAVRTGGKSPIVTRPIRTALVWRLLGCERPEMVVAVNDGYGQLSDDDLLRLDLDDVFSLRLNNKDLTDRCLLNLRAASLTHLSIANAKISDDGIRGLSLGNATTSLALCNCQITDVTMRRLQPLNGLRRITLRHIAITDQGLKFLAGKKIERLDLSGTPISDNGIKNLGTIMELEKLALSSTAIGDAGVALLVHQFPNLSILSLENCSLVTDASLTLFARMRKLREVNLHRTGVQLASIVDCEELEDRLESPLNLEPTTVDAWGGDGAVVILSTVPD